MRKETIVNVVMITYNHEEYIAEAINGVLMQECDFEVELIVANDCSTDNTNNIVHHIIENHPKGNLIQYTVHTKNIGMMRNFRWALEQCKGTYIALCDGDDFWTDPLKLQKQVDFLEQHKNFVLCFTNLSVVDQNSEILEEKRDYGQKSVFDHLDMPIYIHNSTRVFRKAFLPNSPKLLFGFDMYLLVWISKFGKIKYLDSISSCYRIHEGGIYSPLNAKNQLLVQIDTWIHCLDIIDQKIVLKFYSKIIFLFLEITAIAMPVQYYKMLIKLFNKTITLKHSIGLKNSIRIYSTLFVLSIPNLFRKSQCLKKRQYYLRDVLKWHKFKA